MFAHKDQDEKYFSYYGVKLDANRNSKQSYVNSVLQLMTNVDREFAREIYEQMYQYQGDDKILNQLGIIFDLIREPLENRDGLELFDSEISIGKTPPKPRGSVVQEPKEIEVISIQPDLIKIYQDEFKMDLRWKGEQTKQCFMDTFLYKCHQMIKSELNVSFMEFSIDTSCH